MTPKSRLVMPCMFIGVIVALQPNTKNILKRLEPITFPIAISGFFHFGTECTFSAAHALEAEPAIQNADMIFAVGGGKSLTQEERFLRPLKSNR